MSEEDRKAKISIDVAQGVSAAANVAGTLANFPVTGYVIPPLEGLLSDVEKMVVHWPKNLRRTSEQLIVLQETLKLAHIKLSDPTLSGFKTDKLVRDQIRKLEAVKWLLSDAEKTLKDQRTDRIDTNTFYNNMIPDGITPVLENRDKKVTPESPFLDLLGRNLTNVDSLISASNTARIDAVTTTDLGATTGRDHEVLLKIVQNTIAETEAKQSNAEASQQLAAAVSTLTAESERADEQTKSTTAAIEQFTVTAQQTGSLTEGLLDEQIQDHDELSKSITENEFRLIQVGVAAGELAKTNAEVQSSFEEGAAAAGQLVETVQGVSEEAQNLEGGLDLVSEVIEVSSERFERLGESAVVGTAVATEGVETLEGALGEIGPTAEQASAQTQQSLSEIDIAAQKAGQEIQQAFGKVQTDVVDALDGAFRDALDGNLQKFKDFGKTIKGIFKNLFSSIKDSFLDLIAKIAREKIFEPLVGNIFGAIGFPGTGGSGAAGGTAAGGTGFAGASLTTSFLPDFATSSLGNSLGFSSIAARPAPGFIGPMPLAPTVYGDAFNNLTSPAGIAGGIAGSMLSSALFNHREGPGSTIGGTIGSIAGSFIPIPFLGTFIGSFLGSSIGGAFGPKPSRKLEGAEILDLFGDASNVRQFTEDSDRERGSTGQASDHILDAIIGFSRGITEATGGSITLPDSAFDVRVQSFVSRDGAGTPTYEVALAGGEETGKFSTVEAAIGFAFDTLVSHLGGISEHVERGLGNVDFSGSLDDAFADVDFITQFDGLVEAMNGGSRDIADAFNAGLDAEAAGTLAFIQDFKEKTEELFRFQEEKASDVSSSVLDSLSEFGITIGDLSQDFIDQINGAVNDNTGLTETGDAIEQVNQQAIQAAAATRALVESLFTVAEAEEPVTQIQASVELLKAKFEAFNDVFAEVGITASEATTLLGNALTAMGDAFERDLKTLFNDVSGRGFLNNIGTALAQNKTLSADADALGMNTELIDAIFDAQLGSILDSIFGSAENLDAAQASFDHIRTTFENYPEILAAAADAFAAFADTFAAFEMDLDFVEAREKLIESLGEEIDALEEQVRLQETLKNNWSALISGLQSARSRLLTDPSISRLTAEERAQFTLDELEAAFAAAQNGDVDAAAKVSDLALAAAEANKAFFASSEDFARINERIEFILRDTESVAQTQVGLLQSILDANLAQIEILQGQITTANNAPLPSDGPSVVEQLDAQNSDYADALSAFGGPESQFAQTAEFGDFKNRIIDLIGQLNDIGRLQSDYDYLIQGAGENTPLGHAQDNIAQAIAAQLRTLNVPGFATGGVTDGLAIIHPGELLYTGPPARVINAGESAGVMARSGDLVTELRSTRRAIESLNGTVSAANDDQMGGLNRMAMRLGSIESGLELTAARG